MADIKKEQEREELHKAIWSIADDLRGSVDGWDFKQYVLGMMFYRYISENLTNYINAGEREAGDADFDYAKLSDDEAESAREGLVQEKGFFILPSELFSNVRARAKDDENLNSCISILFVPLRAIWCFFGALVPTVSMWFSSVCGRRCGQKMSSPEKVLSAPAERGFVLRIVA